MMAISVAIVMLTWALIQSTIICCNRGYRSLEDNVASSFSNIDNSKLNASIDYGLISRNRMSRLETNIMSANIGLVQNTPAHNQYLFSRPSDDALNLQANADIVSRASLYLIHHYCQRYGLSNDICAHIVSMKKLNGTSLGRLCESDSVNNCQKNNNRFRTIDGTCNNDNNPRWGSALTPYSRISFPAYYDGIQSLRHAVRAGHVLPNPRVVSISLSESQLLKNKFDIGDTKSLALLQWSEFIAHDISHTVVRKMAVTNQPIRCCKNDGYNLSPRHIHPDCAPISIPDNDPVYGKHYIRCMNYVRSLPAVRLDCSFGPIEQVNQVTHFLDGSTIYGSTKERANELRIFEHGKLKIDVWNEMKMKYNNEYLPLNRQDHSLLKTSENICPTGVNNCYKSGDDRVNIDPNLAVLYTIWHREHNRIADELNKLNPTWSDTIIYEEARRIVIAEIQHITYNEWLPMIIGNNYLTNGVQANQYKINEEPSVINEAVTAVFQYINYLKEHNKFNSINNNGKLRRMENKNDNSNLPQLSEFFYKPRIIEIGNMFDDLIRGLSNQMTDDMGVEMISNITKLLNATNGQSKNVGLDILSLDIQRGRDHGLANYNYYREYCGLSSAKTFDDYLDVIPSEIVNKLKTLYDHPNDIDLIVGGMSELLVTNNVAILGPTFKCLLWEQLAKTRRTDRYFYNSKAQPYPFTNDQLNEIQHVTLARIFCDNSNNIIHMHPNAFLNSQDTNVIRSCNDTAAIPRLNLHAWLESTITYV